MPFPSKLPTASVRDDCDDFASKLETASVRDDCPGNFEGVGEYSNRSYIYLLDNEGNYIRNWQGKPIIVGFPPEFPTKLEVSSCRDE